MAVSGLRILLPGYHVIVLLAQFGTGSYDPPVMLVTVGMLLLLQGIVMVTGVSGLYAGLITALGVTIGISKSPHTLLRRTISRLCYSAKNASEDFVKSL